MALDYGEKRIGVALSDPLALFAKPHSIIQRESNLKDFDRLRQIIVREGVVKVVIGLPTDEYGGLSRQAEKVVRWAEKLAIQIDAPIVFWDESYSSEWAVNFQYEKSNRKSSAPHRIDDLAAAIILQDYLDARGANDEPGKSLTEITGDESSS